MQDYIFHKDRLLLRKDSEGRYHVPYESELPDELLKQRLSHEVLLPNGSTIRATDIDHEIPEDDTQRMVGLRASFDYLPLNEYKAAGKAFQIIWWDRHSHFCPVCGTPTEKQTPIMKKCPACGYEIYPPISTAIIVLIRRGEDEVLCHEFKCQAQNGTHVLIYVNALTGKQQHILLLVEDETGTLVL